MDYEIIAKLIVVSLKLTEMLYSLHERPRQRTTFLKRKCKSSHQGNSGIRRGGGQSMTLPSKWRVVLSRMEKKNNL